MAVAAIILSNGDSDVLVQCLFLLSVYVCICVLSWSRGYKKLEFSLKLKIKLNDWLLADTCPQAANYCALY